MNIMKGSAIFLAALLVGLGSVEMASTQEEKVKPSSRRIVGGKPTSISKHPWQVALQVRGRFFCGGSVIADRWVLTAAHCFVHSQRSDDWRSKARATNYAAEGVWDQIERIVIHPNYDASTFENDIALVKLKKASGQMIPRDEATSAMPAGQELEVTGWGAITEDGKGSRVLQKVVVYYADTASCNAPDAHNGKIMRSMLCAGYPKGGRDACQGDSGGPLVWRRPDGPILVGVVSWGVGCARELKYGVYTRVSAYGDWINQTLAVDSK